MTIRRASCCCGQLTVECTGEPFRREQLVIAGRTAEYIRIGDEGGHARFRFCPDCGSTLYWDHSEGEDNVAVAVGAFADPGFPPPTVSVYAVRRHPWVSVPPSVVESWD